MAKKVAIGNICSLMFLCMFLIIFDKSEKHVLMFFICKTMFLTFMG